MHPAISINTLSLAPASLAEQVDTVARIGARAISPGIEQVRETGIERSACLIRDAGLQVATLTHRAFGFATAADVADARERLAGTIEVASAIGAQTVIMTTGGRGALTWAQAAGAFAEAYAPCAALAEQAGVRVGIEPTSHLYADSSIVHRLADTTAVARMAGVSVIIDTFACWFDADIEQAIADAAPSQTSGEWARLSANLTGEQHARLEAVQAALTEDRRKHLGFEDAVSMNQTIRFVIRNAPQVSGVA